MKARFLSVVLLSALLLGALGCSQQSASPSGDSLRQVTVAMGYIPNVQFAPMYVALERGYFADEGLDVQLDYGMETDLLQEVGANRLQFAITSGDQVILARGNGLPVRYVLDWYRRFPVCVVSLQESGITQPQDLVGKTVGTPVMEGASYIGWLAFLQEVGISSDSVTLQAIGYTQVASLTEKRVDAAICYAFNEPVQLREAGYALNTFYLDQYTRLVSNGLVTNDETIRNDPELVRALVRGFLRGLQDTLDDPEAAFAITRKAIPEMDDATAELQHAVLLEAINYWRADQLGANVPADWDESVAFLKQIGLLQADIEPQDIYTNDFIP